MARTKRMAVMQEDSDDGGAPEEVNMSTGKDEAEKLRREERESRKRIIAAAKEKRKKASGPKEGQSKKKKAEAQATAGGADELDDEEEPQNQQRASRAVTHGLLNESIVKYLAEQERKVVETKDSQSEEVEPRKRKVKRKKMEGGDASTGDEKMVVLSKVQPRASTFHTAMKFKQNRLYGEGVHRSLVMLRKRVK